MQARLQAYASDPSSETSQQLLDEGVALGSALNAVVRELAADEELTERERANSIATVYYEVRDKRVELFRSKAPEGDYDASLPTPEQIAENVLDYFNAGMDADEIADEAEESYMGDFICDLDEFSEFLEPSKKMRAKNLARQVGEHAFDVGKISAGVIIGSVLLQKNKKFSL